MSNLSFAASGHRLEKVHIVGRDHIGVVDHSKKMPVRPLPFVYHFDTQEFAKNWQYFLFVQLSIRVLLDNSLFR